MRVLCWFIVAFFVLAMVSQDRKSQDGATAVAAILGLALAIWTLA